MITKKQRPKKVRKVHFRAGGLPQSRKLDFHRGDIRKHAVQIVQALEEYWGKLGHEVKFTVVFNSEMTMYSIVSDLKNGLPQEDLSRAAYNKLVRIK